MAESAGGFEFPARIGDEFLEVLCQRDNFVTRLDLVLERTAAEFGFLRQRWAARSLPLQKPQGRFRHFRNAHPSRLARTRLLRVDGEDMVPVAGGSLNPLHGVGLDEGSTAAAV